MPIECKLTGIGQYMKAGSDVILTNSKTRQWRGTQHWHKALEFLTKSLKTDGHQWCTGAGA